MSPISTPSQTPIKPENPPIKPGNHPSSPAQPRNTTEDGVDGIRPLGEQDLGELDLTEDEIKKVNVKEQVKWMLHYDPKYFIVSTG